MAPRGWIQGRGGVPAEPPTSCLGARSLGLGRLSYSALSVGAGGAGAGRLRRRRRGSRRSPALTAKQAGAPASQYAAETRSAEGAPRPPRPRSSAAGRQHRAVGPRHGWHPTGRRRRGQLKEACAREHECRPAALT